MQIEAVKPEVVICSVRSSVSEAHTKVHNDKEERRVPISKRLRDTSHNKEMRRDGLGCNHTVLMSRSMQSSH